MKKQYPILEFDGTSPALINPITSRGVDDFPEHCVICFFQDVISRLEQEGFLTEIACLNSEMGPNPIYQVEGTNKPVALFNPGVGAALAASFFEEVIAIGGKKFVACGGAGSLDPSFTLGKLMLPISAVRDEGTSYHYLEPSYEVAVSDYALTKIRSVLDAKTVPYELVKSWTTDAPYRETKAKIQLRQENGCKCVEMETAAFFAVAQFRNVEFAQILYSGDDVSGEVWDERAWNSQEDIRSNLLKLTIESCLAL